MLTERAHTLRSHPGQVSFPGGRVDPEDDGSVAAALRRQRRRSASTPPVSRCSRPSPRSSSPRARTPSPRCSRGGPRPCRWASSTAARSSGCSACGSPTCSTRRTASPRCSGPYRGPGFEVDGLFVWGFTAMLLSSLFDLAGVDACRGTTPSSAALPERVARPGCGVAASERRRSCSTWCSSCSSALYAWSGWRQGFLSAVLGLVGLSAAPSSRCASSRVGSRTTWASTRATLRGRWPSSSSCSPRRRWARR